MLFRSKVALDKALREKGELTKQLRARMSAEEQLAAAKKEAEEAKDRELEELKGWKAKVEATERYKSLEMDDTLAKETAEAEISGDMEKVRSCFERHIKAVKENTLKKFLADRPQIAAGNGAADAKDAIIERAKGIAKQQSGVNEDILKNYIGR